MGKRNKSPRATAMATAAAANKANNATQKKVPAKDIGAKISKKQDFGLVVLGLLGGVVRNTYLPRSCT